MSTVVVAVVTGITCRYNAAVVGVVVVAVVTGMPCLYSAVVVGYFLGPFSFMNDGAPPTKLNFWGTLRNFD